MTSLRSFFPSLKTREEVFTEINTNVQMKLIFNSWPEKERNRFLDICSGNRGLTVLYDVYFQEIFNPDVTPERLVSLLSVLLDQDVVSISSLRRNSSVLEDNQSLMTLDIVVILHDGSVVDVEMQKIGYRFPGQRACCYSSDLVLRQYGQIKSTRQKEFSYRDMKPVYSIIFMESSPKEFRNDPETYIHRFRQKSDTGLELPLLQNYIFVPLDNFRDYVHNKGVNNLSRLDAWLLFLSTDDPEKIYLLLETYPEFRPLYEQIFDICQNTGRMMEMFSRELQMMDHNTVKLMIDDMKEEIQEKSAELQAKSAELQAKNAELQAKAEEFRNTRAELDAQLQEVEKRDKTIEALEKEVKRLKESLNR